MNIVLIVLYFVIGALVSAFAAHQADTEGRGYVEIIFIRTFNIIAWPISVVWLASVLIQEKLG